MKVLIHNICGKIVPEFEHYTCKGCCFDKNRIQSNMCVPPSVVKCFGSIFISTSKDIFKL
jgi:hypothetical protein